MNAENQLQENKIDNLTANLSKLEKAVTDGRIETKKGFEKVYDKFDIMEAHFIKKDMFEKELEYIKKQTETEIETLRKQISALQKINWWIMTTVGTIILGALMGSILLIK